MRHKFLIFATLFVCLVPPALAAPIKEKAKLEGDLAAVQKKLVTSAASTQRAEGDQAEVEEKMRILSDQLKLKNTALESSRKNLAALVQAALHLSQMPPEAMVMMSPNEDAIRVARAIKMTSDGIRDDMQSIRLQTAELKRLQQKLAAKKTDLVQKQAKLGKERQRLKTSLAERQALHEKLGHRQPQEIEKTAQLAKKAGDLQALVTSIYAAPDLGQPKKGSLRSFSAAKGRIRWPLEGRLLHKFGVSAGNDGTNRGLLIAARTADARVVAPFDGEVVFTGSFLAYGRMVILRHSDDFHTLLAGLSGIDVSVGDFLLEGEPIGAMGDSDTDEKLYVELRKDNQPIDPETWIKKK